MSSFFLRDFSGGRDLRPGQFAGRLKNRFNVLDNYFVNKGKKLQRRWPCRKVTGAVSANAQGVVRLNGQLYRLAKKGDAVVDTVVSPTINVLRFDNPDFCTTWTLLQAMVYNGFVVATVRHTFPGTVVTSRVFLHVFDGSLIKPTYVEDPYCPTSWAPTLPLHVYRAPVAPQVVGAFKDYTPFLGQTGTGKLYMSGPDGNTYFSKVRNPRAWNTRTQQQFLDNGEWWYFIAPAGVAGVYNFVVSEKFADLALDQKWAAYVLEYLDATGTWQRFVEDTVAPTVDHHYFPATIASRFAGGAAEIQLQVYLATPADTIMRWRAIAGAPPLQLVGTLTTLNYPTEYFNGDGATVNFQAAAIPYLVAFDTGAVNGLRQVWKGGVLQTAGVDYTMTNVGGFVRVTFTVAPPVGVGNVALVSLVNYRVPSITFEGVGYVFQSGAEDYPAASTSKYYTLFWSGTGANGTLPGTPFPNGRNRYLNRIVELVTADASSPPVFTVSAYQYGVDAKSAFYVDKQAAYLGMAGFGEAGFLPSMSKNNDGGLITGMHGLKASIVVHYSESTQLWSSHTDQTLDGLIGITQVGTGVHSTGVTAEFYDQSVALSARGIRSFSATGLNNDNVQDNNIGDPIEEFKAYTMVGCVFWPWTGQLVCAMQSGSALEFHVFDFSKDEKISAWSRWTVAGITSMSQGTLNPFADRLFFSVGTSLYYFDASATSFRDDNDAPGAGNAYQSIAEWPLLTMDRPKASKDFAEMDLAQSGICTISFKLQQQDGTLMEDPRKLLLEATTYAQGKVELGMAAVAIAPRIVSTDEASYPSSVDPAATAGHTIEQIELVYELTER